MNTYVYVDAMNLFYGVLKGQRYKWLDIGKLVCTLLPQANITRVKYFTADVNPSSSNPSQFSNQQAYLRALSLLGNIDIIKGQYFRHKVNMESANPPPPTCEVYKNEEKGSDVNLGSHLLMDAFRNKFQEAVVISGDSDLVTPIRMVHQELNLPVIVINPQYKTSKMRKSFALRNNSDVARYKSYINPRSLGTSQLPNPVQNGAHIVHKPVSW